MKQIINDDSKVFISIDLLDHHSNEGCICGIAPLSIQLGKVDRDCQKTKRNWDIKKKKIKGSLSNLIKL